MFWLIVITEHFWNTVDFYKNGDSLHVQEILDAIYTKALKEKQWQTLTAVRVANKTARN